MALLAQIIELGEGHRHSVDGHELEVAAINGAVGAPVGFGMGLIGGAAMGGLRKLAAKPAFAGLSKNTQSLTRFGTVVAFNAGYWALTGMAEAAAQDSVYGLSGDWVAGAANGSFNAVWGARHNAHNPAGRFALSPAEHAEEFLDHCLATLHEPSRSAQGTTTSTPVPPLPGSADSHFTDEGPLGLGRGSPGPYESFLDLSPDADSPGPGESFLDLSPDDLGEGAYRQLTGP
ncbi:hypothetical protein [Streptomyces sp. NPDC001068]|uniref:hypothetical protein n=1 Tax=Streptomyces sp. NPDC001068 TaxID=3364544 RepID=UPI00369B8B72